MPDAKGSSSAQAAACPWGDGHGGGPSPRSPSALPARSPASCMGAALSAKSRLDSFRSFPPWSVNFLPGAAAGKGGVSPGGTGVSP